MRWIVFFLVPIALFAKPKGHSVAAGSASVSEMGSTMEIQASERAIINWDEFSIQKGEITRFVQPGADSAVLNRVSQGISKIDGLLEANGRVYLVNPNGMVVGPSGCIQAESFIASTLDLENEDFFKNQELLFQGNSKARLINFGKISVTGGDVFLLGRAVVNEGLIEAGEGIVGLAAGSEILLKPSGMQRLFICPKQEEAEDGGIENRGLIEAAHAELRADGNAFRFAINQEGIIEASGIKEERGRVFLVAEKGTSINQGTIRSPGGKVHVLGDQVGVNDGGRIDVSSKENAGEVLIGGDFQGKNPDIPNAKMTVLMEGGEIVADSKEGGRVILWSDENCFMQGEISAQGDAGFVEVSGKENLCFEGNVLARELLLDPSQIRIGPNASSDIIFDFATGTFSATSGFGNINQTALENALNQDTITITVTTESSFNAFPEISMFDAEITWTSSSDLILKSEKDIVLNHKKIESTGSGSLILEAGQDISLATGTTSTIDGSILMTAGRDINSGSGGGGATLRTTGTGNIRMDADRDLIMGSPGGMIGPMSITTEKGDIDVRVGRNLEMYGSELASGPTMLGFVGTPDNLVNGRFDIGGDLILRGGRFMFTDTFALIGADRAAWANMTFNVRGKIELTGGATEGSAAVIGFLPTIATPEATTRGNITFETILGDITLTSGSAPETFAHIGSTNGFGEALTHIHMGNVEIFQNLNGITLESGVSSAGIGFGSTSSPGIELFNGDINVQSPGDVLLKGSGMGLAFIGTTETPAGSVNLTIESSNLISAVGQIYATGSILAIADRNIALENTSSVESLLGPITLVVDNQEPDEPDVGDGRFILDSTSSISTLKNNVPIRIFTAKRPQNEILGLIEGTEFVPGPFFIDSATEQWATYFPDDFGGIPFTIFYKTGILSTIASGNNMFGKIFTEMMQNLRTYDDLLFETKCFLLGYDKECYDQLFHPKGMVSSFDLFGDETKAVLRQKYRNYHTKYVDSF